MHQASSQVPPSYFDTEGSVVFHFRTGCQGAEQRADAVQRRAIAHARWHGHLWAQKETAFSGQTRMAAFAWGWLMHLRAPQLAIQKRLLQRRWFPHHGCIHEAGNHGWQAAVHAGDHYQDIRRPNGWHVGYHPLQSRVDPQVLHTGIVGSIKPLLSRQNQCLWPPPAPAKPFPSRSQGLTGVHVLDESSQAHTVHAQRPT